MKQVSERELRCGYGGCDALYGQLTAVAASIPCHLVISDISRKCNRILGALRCLRKRSGKFIRFKFQK